VVRPWSAQSEHRRLSAERVPGRQAEFQRVERENQELERALDRMLQSLTG